MYNIAQIKRNAKLLAEISKRVSAVDSGLENDYAYTDIIVSQDFTEKGYEVGIARWRNGGMKQPTVPSETRVVITREEIEKILEALP
jgi:hypothetical protein